MSGRLEFDPLQLTLDSLNNFCFCLPGGFYRTLSTSLDVPHGQLTHIDLLSYHSTRYLEMTPRQLHEFIDRIIVDLGMTVEYVERLIRSRQEARRGGDMDAIGRVNQEYVDLAGKLIPKLIEEGFNLYDLIV